jgi:hypothetical protein
MPILQWLDRDKHLSMADAVPYRLLEADDAYSAGDADSPNMLIQGDNLEGLKALLPYYANSVKCIFIDPPYNTRSAFEQTMSSFMPNVQPSGSRTRCHDRKNKTRRTRIAMKTRGGLGDLTILPHATSTAKVLIR